MRDADAPWLFLPLVGSFLAHLPVLRLDWFKGLKRPVDGGATLRSRRLFGDNKTWRGMIVMGAGVWVATGLLARWPWYWSKLPVELTTAGPAAVGLLLALGTVLGELPGSFIKRQLDIAPGAQRRSGVGMLISMWDQGDFVPGIAVLLIPLWVMPLRQIALSFVAVSVLHLAISGAGYALGVRKTVL